MTAVKTVSAKEMWGNDSLDRNLSSWGALARPGTVDHSISRSS